MRYVRNTWSYLSYMFRPKIFIRFAEATGKSDTLYKFDMNKHFLTQVLLEISTFYALSVHV